MSLAAAEDPEPDSAYDITRSQAFGPNRRYIQEEIAAELDAHIAEIESGVKAFRDGSSLKNQRTRERPKNGDCYFCGRDFDTECFPNPCDARRWAQEEQNAEMARLPWRQGYS